MNDFISNINGLIVSSIVVLFSATGAKLYGFVIFKSKQEITNINNKNSIMNIEKDILRFNKVEKTMSTDVAVLKNKINNTDSKIDQVISIIKDNKIDSDKKIKHLEILLLDVIKKK